MNLDTLMSNDAFKLWLLDDTNALIKHNTCLTLWALAIIGVLILLAILLLWHCMRISKQHQLTKNNLQTTQQKHREAVELFSSIDSFLNKDPLHPMVLHQDFGVVRANAAALDVFGDDSDGEESNSFTTFLAGNEMLQAFTAHLAKVRQNGTATNTFTMYDKSGTPRQVVIYTAKIKSMGGNDMLSSSLKIIDN